MSSQPPDLVAALRAPSFQQDSEWHSPKAVYATKPRDLLDDAADRIETLEACVRCDDESVRTAWAREAEMRQAIRRARGLLLYPLREHLDDHGHLNTTGLLAVADELLAVEDGVTKPLGEKP